MELLDVGKLIKNLNPVNGCTIGCPYCYAKRINDRFHITPVWNEPVFVPERLPRLNTKKPNNYLMTSMSDFSDWQPGWREQVFAQMAQNPQHRYLFLTKRPERLSFATTLETAWLGVTVTSAGEKTRIGTLLQNAACPHYFVTFEPLFGELGPVPLEGIGWVVIGTETGNRKGKVAAQKEWVLSLARQAHC